MKQQNLEAKVKKLEQRIKELEDEKFDGTLHVSVVQDKSGSMYDQVGDVIGGFNTYIKELADDEDTEDIRLTLTQFDTNTTVVEENTLIGKVKPLTEKTYRTGGGTALLDAVGTAVERMEREVKKATL